jgi:hypothetical protein
MTLVGGVGGMAFGGIGAGPVAGKMPSGSLGLTGSYFGFGAAYQDIRENGVNLCNAINLATSGVAIVGSAYQVHIGISNSQATRYLQQLEQGSPSLRPPHASSRHGPSAPDEALWRASLRSNQPQTGFVSWSEMANSIKSVMEEDIVDIETRPNSRFRGTWDYSGTADAAY